jgi:recombinational DNA repair protein (RecF pathway)
VAGLSLQFAGFVLQKPPPDERYQQVLVFSAEQGHLRCFQRLSSRQSAVALDLFDEVEAMATSSNQGRTWFFSEVRVRRRFAGIGLSFAALSEASAFVTLLARNPTHEDSRAAAYALLGTALQAWSEGAHPEIVTLKVLYSFARAEGYPVKEDWAAGLRGSDSENARRFLNEPLAALAGSDPDSVARLLENLRRYLKGHTDIVMGP